MSDNVVRTMPNGDKGSSTASNDTGDSGVNPARLAKDIASAFGSPLTAKDVSRGLDAIESAAGANAGSDLLALYCARRAPVASGIGQTKSKSAYAPRHLQIGSRSPAGVRLAFAAADGIKAKPKMVIVSDIAASEEADLKAAASEAGAAGTSLEIVSGAPQSPEAVRRAGRYRYASIHFDGDRSFLGLHADWFAYAPRLYVGGYAVISGYQGDDQSDAGVFVDNLILSELSDYFEPVLEAGGAVVLRKIGEPPAKLVESLESALPLSVAARNVDALRARIDRERLFAREQEAELAANRDRVESAEEEINSLSKRAAQLEDDLRAARKARAESDEAYDNLKGEFDREVTATKEDNTGLREKLSKIELELRIARNTMRDREVELAQATEKVNAQGGVQKDLRKQLEEAESRLKKLDAELAEAHDRRIADTEAFASVREKLSSAEDAREKAEHRAARMEERADAAASAKEETAVALAEASARATGLEEARAALREQIDSLKADMANETATRREAEAALQRAHDDIAGLQRNFQGATREIEELQSSLSSTREELEKEGAARRSLEAAKAELEAARAELEKEKAALTEENAALQKSLAEEQAERAAADARIEDMLREQEAFESELAAARAMIADMEAERDQLRQSVTELEAGGPVAEAAERRAAELDGQLAALREQLETANREYGAASQRATAAERRAEAAEARARLQKQSAKDEIRAARRRAAEDAGIEVAELKAKLAEAEKVSSKDVDTLRKKVKEADHKRQRAEDHAKRLDEKIAAEHRRAVQSERQLHVLEEQMQAPRILLPALLKSTSVRIREKLGVMSRGAAANQDATPARAEKLKAKAAKATLAAPSAEEVNASKITIPETPETHDAGPPQHDQTFFANYTFGGKTRYLQRSDFLRETMRAGRALDELKGAFKGERCWVIGNGPSLNHQNLYQLQDEFTIGSNYIYMNKDKMGGYPTIISFANYLVIKQRLDEIMGLEDPIKALPFYLYDDFGSPKNSLILNMQHQTPNFSLKASDYASTASTVTYVNLQLAYHLGFDKVYLIGVDNRYKQPDHGKEGTVLSQEEDDPNHFTPNYFKGLKWQKGDEEKMESLYARAKIAFEARGSKVIDCTYNGALTIFDKQDFDTVIRTSPPPAREKIDRAVETMRKVTSPKKGDALTPKKVVITISPDLEDRFGHHYNMDKYLRDIAHADGNELISLCSANLDPLMRDEHNWLTPAFNVRTWYSLRDEKVIKRKSNQFKQDLRKALAVIEKAHDPDMRYTLYMYTGNLPLAKAVAEVARTKPNMDVAVHHFYAAMMDMEDPEIVETSSRQIAEIEQLGARLYLGTDELVDYYEKKTGFRLGYLGDPSVTFSDDEVKAMITAPENDRPIHGPMKVFFPPNMNVEKGYRTGVAAARSIVESEELSQELSPVLRFVPRPSTPENVVAEAAVLKENPKARFVEGVISDEEFQNITRGADIIAIPYTRKAFDRRMSGSLTDALMTAKPIVATKGTYVGNQVERFGCGEVFEDGDADGLVKALRRVRSDYPRYKKAALKARKEYFKERSWDSLYRRVIQNR